ncbi:FAD binding domain protein [Microdochium bolleyi]|uniref:Delta(24)-sterol reductase n=1 Tax=Microdochium bolleyi TaxID=196109 RepID=A0A136IVP0_9PEZI|nr:FAD binding domain protein [Microdochium bolleyi]
MQRPLPTMDAHNAAVARISARVQTFYEQKTPFRLYHGSTNSTRAISRSASNTVDTSALNHVLSVDIARKTALCEPNVPMDDLLAATLKHGLVPLIVMELPSITVGGGFSGMAGESSSFRHGPFDSIVSSIEIVLPNGDVTTASRTERADLFWGAACAFGTLGIVTLLEVQLRDAADYVEMTYFPFPDITAASAKLQEETAKPEVDYVDAIAFSPSNIVVCVGKLVNTLPRGVAQSAVKRYTRRTDPWYYLDVQKSAAAAAHSKSKPGEPWTDHVAIADYLFRWDRGGFWVARYAYTYFFAPFNRITRAVLDRFMHAKVMYHALHKSGLSDQYIIQDVGVPYRAADEFRGWLDANFNIYPLWLCPIKIRRDDGPEVAGHGLHADFADPAKTPEPILLNFGVWGPASTRYETFVRQNRDLEAKVHSLGGKKTLYAQNHYTRDEFWGWYNKDKYDRVRVKYYADWMPDVWDKVGHVDQEARRRRIAESRMPKALQGKRPFQGLYGVYKAWRGGDYLLGKGKAVGVQEAKRE